MCVCTFLCSICVSFASVPMVEYTFLSESASRSGQLSYYDDIPKKIKTLTLGDYQLKFSIPKQIRGYDVVPVQYTLFSPEEVDESDAMLDPMANYFKENSTASTSTSDISRHVAIEAIAFEDPKKAKNKALYDLAIPGDLKVEIEYRGCISTEYAPDRFVPSTDESENAPVGSFSPFNTNENGPILSSPVKPSHFIWYKFCVKNAGDTILDPEGLGATFAEPFLHKYKENGEVEWTAKPENIFIRHSEYIYPGESAEFWVSFDTPNSHPYEKGLLEGRYQIDFRMLRRFYDKHEWGSTIWAGTEFAKLEVPFEVKSEGENKPIETRFSSSAGENMPKISGAFEEFMTSFRIYDGSQPGKVRNTIYLQVAPWTEQIVVKLILTDPKQIVVAKIPVTVTDENPDITDKEKMMHCLQAAYPRWKATHEEGTLWSDYLCDGVASETQKRELKILTDHFLRMEK